MSKTKELLELAARASKRTVRIQALAAKIDTAPDAADRYQTEVLFSYLELAVEYLQNAQKMAAYLSRPIQETSRLWKNGSGQYETTAGFPFREGSPIEVLVPDKYCPDSFHWERTYLRYDGRDYYLDGHASLTLKGLAVRVREGDQP